MKALNPLVVLLLLTLGAMLVHGYHPFAEDAEIYLPSVEKIVQPDLFGSDTGFFAPYARFSVFSRCVALPMRWTHLSLETSLFLWHVASLFLLLFAAWTLAAQCLPSPTARWAGVGMVTALLTLPVAGTALYLFDQYVNSRNLETFAGMFAIAAVLKKKYLAAALWLLFAVAVHPLMGCLVLLFLLVFALESRIRLSHGTFPCLAIFAFFLGQASPAYREAAKYHAYHNLLNWRWYEWLGIFGPMAILWLLSRWARTRQLKACERVCRALIVFAAICFAAALILSSSGRWPTLPRFQPLRGLHLLYLLFLLLLGGWMGDQILKKSWWRWLLLFAPLSAAMFLAQRALFPASAHVEWPWSTPRNPWAQAFLWARGNTPINARFALDPFYMQVPGEDAIGFRALAQRSRLADAGKDSGAASMFPFLAGPWWKQMQVQQDWRRFSAPDFLRLRDQYGVNWIILQTPGVPGLSCPYRERAVLVCKLE